MLQQLRGRSMVQTPPSRPPSSAVGSSNEGVLADKLEQAYVQVQALERENGELKRELQVTESEAAGKIRQVQAELDRQVTSWQKQAAQYQKTNASLESTLNAVTTQLERAYSQQQQQQQQQPAPANGDSKSMSNREHQLSRELDAERKYKAVAQKQMRELTTRIHQLEHELKQKERSEAERSGKESEGVHQMQGELDKAKKNNVNLAVGYRDLEEEYTKLSKQKVDLERELEQVKNGTRERVQLLQQEHSKQLDHTIQTAQRTQVELHALKSKLMQDRAHESARLESRVQSTQQMAKNATQKLMQVQNELQDQQAAADRRIAELQKVVNGQRRQLDQIPYSAEEYQQMGKRLEENKSLRAELLLHVNKVDEMNKELADLRLTSAESADKAALLEAELQKQIQSFNSASTDTSQSLQKVTGDLRQAMLKQNELLEKYHTEQRDNVRLRDELSYTRALTQHEAEVKLGQMSTELKVQQGWQAKQLESLEREAEVARQTAAVVRTENEGLKKQLEALNKELAAERQRQEKKHKVLVNALESERAANSYFQTSQAGGVAELLQRQQKEGDGKAGNGRAKEREGAPSRPTSAPSGRGGQGRFGRGLGFMDPKPTGGVAGAGSGASGRDLDTLEALPQLVGTLRRKGLYCTEAIEALQRAARIAAPAEYHTALRSALNDQLATEAGKWARDVAAADAGRAGAAAAGGRGGRKQQRQEQLHALGIEGQLLVFAARAAAQPRALLREAGVDLLFRLASAHAPPHGHANADSDGGLVRGEVDRDEVEVHVPPVPVAAAAAAGGAAQLAQMIAEVVTVEGALAGLSKAVVDHSQSATAASSSAVPSAASSAGIELMRCRKALSTLADVLVTPAAVDAVYATQGQPQPLASKLLELARAGNGAPELAWHVVSVDALRCVRALAHMDAARLQRATGAAQPLLTTIAALSAALANQRAGAAHVHGCESLVLSVQALAFVLQDKDGRKEAARWSSNAVGLILELILSPPAGVGPGLGKQLYPQLYAGRGGGAAGAAGAGAGAGAGKGKGAELGSEGDESAGTALLRTYAVRCLAVLSLNAKAKRQLRAGRGPAVLVALVQDDCELEQRKRAMQALGNLMLLDRGEGRRLFTELAKGAHQAQSQPASAGGGGSSSGSGSTTGVDAIVSCMFSTDPTLQRLAFRFIAAASLSHTEQQSSQPEPEPEPEIRTVVRAAMAPCARLVSGASDHPALAEALQIMGADLRFASAAASGSGSVSGSGLAGHEYATSEWVSHLARHVRAQGVDERTRLSAVEVLSLLLLSPSCTHNLLHQRELVAQLVPALLQTAQLEGKVAEAQRVAAITVVAELCVEADELCPLLGGGQGAAGAVYLVRQLNQVRGSRMVPDELTPVQAEVLRACATLTDPRHKREGFNVANAFITEGLFKKMLIWVAEATRASPAVDFMETTLMNLASQENAQVAFANHLDLLLSIAPARVWKLRMVHKLCAKGGQPCRTVLEKRRTWQALIQTLTAGLLSPEHRVQAAAALTTLPFTKYSGFRTQLCAEENQFVVPLLRASQSEDADLRRAATSLLKELRKDSRVKKHLKKTEKEMTR